MGRGGPRTPEGKANSRGNALTHGLTATRLLPAVLGHDLLERHARDFGAEWDPRTPTERLLVREIARHAAALELVEQAQNGQDQPATPGTPPLAADPKPADR